MTKHTPGPWTVESSDDENGWIVDADAKLIGIGYGLANVRLIAAAPDLLEYARTLEALCDLAAIRLEDNNLDDDLVNTLRFEAVAARVAIRKAESQIR